MQDRPSSITARGHRKQAAGHRSRGASRRATRGSCPDAQGFRVVPCSSVEVQLMPPNSLAVVWAASTAPAVLRRGHRGVIVIGDPVSEDHGGVCGRPALDPLQLLHPEGHTSERQRNVGLPGCLVGRLEVGVAEGVERGPLAMASMEASSASSGETSPARKASTRLQASSDPGGRHRREVPPRPGPSPARAGPATGALGTLLLVLTTPALVVDRVRSRPIWPPWRRPSRVGGCVPTSRPTSARRSPPARPPRSPAFTCATIAEMEGMARAGLGDDLLLANEVVDATRLGALARAGARVTVAVDSEETIDAAAPAGVARGADRRQRRAAALRVQAGGRRPPGRPGPCRGSRGAGRDGLRGPRRRSGRPGEAHRAVGGVDGPCWPPTDRSVARSSRPAVPGPTT